MHSLVESCICPDQGSNPQPQCINQLTELWDLGSTFKNNNLVGGGEGGFGGLSGDRRRRLVVNTQHSVEVMCCGIEHLRPV